MVAKGKTDKQCLMVRGADFSKQIPAKFEARVKGKGRIDVYVNNLKGTPLVSLIICHTGSVVFHFNDYLVRSLMLLEMEIY